METAADTRPASIVRAYASAAAEAIAEAIWPTRCAVCGEPESLICEKCLRELPYLDLWRACPRCGAAFGRVQCTECNPVTLLSTGRDRLPFESLTSALHLTKESRAIVTAYKDAGERRLAHEMARIMAEYVSPEERAEAHGIVFVPATAAARARRGFDHAELLAEELARVIGTPVLPLLGRPRALDQRALSRHERIANMSRTIRSTPGASAPETLILIDDVCTTGATLSAACDALAQAGARRIRCLTFARV